MQGRYGDVAWTINGQPTCAIPDMVLSGTVDAKAVPAATITFYNEDGRVHSTLTVPDGWKVGDIPFPDVQGRYGDVVWIINGQPTSAIPDMVISGTVDAKAVSEATITFYNEDGTVHSTKKVPNGRKVKDIRFPVVKGRDGEDAVWTINGQPISAIPDMVIIGTVDVKAVSASGASIDTGVGGFIGQINEVLETFRKIALPLASLALAYCVFGILFGNEKEIETAKARIKYILIAIAVLFLLPAIINQAISVASGLAWNPASPSTVPPAGTP